MSTIDQQQEPCDYCAGTGEIEMDNNGPIESCPICEGRNSKAMSTYVPFSKYEIDVPDGAVFDEIMTGCPHCGRPEPRAVFELPKTGDWWGFDIPPAIAEHVAGCELRRGYPFTTEEYHFVLSTDVEVETE